MLKDASGSIWNLTAADGTVQPNQTVAVLRKGRAMSLNNRDGDTVVLIDPNGAIVDERSYTKDVATDEVIEFGL